MNVDRISSNLTETVNYLFDRDYEMFPENEDEAEKLENTYDALIDEYGWSNTFEAIDRFMREKCLDGISVCNFAHNYWIYNCSNFRKIDDPYRFWAICIIVLI